MEAQMRILVVEDDTTTALLLEKALRRMGHDVTVASGGGPAWELYARDPFPVVVTDWEMPEVDGLELTKRVRHARSRGYTWVIMLTAREADHHMDKAVESGVDDFLQKPLDLRLLAVRLKVAERVVAMGAQVAAHALQQGEGRWGFVAKNRVLSCRIRRRPHSWLLSGLLLQLFTAS